MTDIWVGAKVEGVLGSNYNPHPTIAAALATAVIGDTIRITAGTYDVDVTVPVDGITLVGTGVTIRSLILTNRKNVTATGFTIVGQKTLPGNWVAMPASLKDVPGTVIVPAESWTTRGPKVASSYVTYMSIVDSWQATFTKGVNCQAAENIVLADLTISRHTAGVAITGAAKTISLTNIKVTQCRMGIWVWEAGSAVSATGVTITRCRVTQSYYTGIALTNAVLATVRNCVVEYSAISHYSMSGCFTSIVVDCLGRYGGYYSETMQIPGSSAVNVFASGSGCVIEGCTMIGQLDPTAVDGNGAIVDTSTNPVTIRNCVMIGNAGSGIALTLSPNCIAIGNVLSGNKYGIALSAAGNKIQNNVFHASTVAHIQTGGNLPTQAAVDGNAYGSGSLFVRDSYGATLNYTTVEALKALGLETTGVGS